MDELERKFVHKTWYKGQDMTVKQFLEEAVKSSSGLYLSQVLAKEQSENLFAERKYDFCIKSEEGRGCYRLTDVMYKYLLEVEKAINCKMKRQKGLTE